MQVQFTRANCEFWHVDCTRLLCRRNSWAADFRILWHATLPISVLRAKLAHYSHYEFWWCYPCRVDSDRLSSIASPCVTLHSRTFVDSGTAKTLWCRLLSLLVCSTADDPLATETVGRGLDFDCLVASTFKINRPSIYWRMQEILVYSNWPYCKDWCHCYRLCNQLDIRFPRALGLPFGALDIPVAGHQTCRDLAEVLMTVYLLDVWCWLRPPQPPKLYFPSTESKKEIWRER